MKIAVLTEILSTHSGSRAPIELAKYLARENEITVFAFDFQKEETVEKELKERGIKIVLASCPLTLGKWRAAFKFWSSLRKNDIISFHGTFPAFLVAKLSGRPIVKTYYGTQFDAYLEKILPSQKPNFVDKIFNWFGNQRTYLLEKINFHLADQVVGISQYAGSEGQRLYQRKIPFIYLSSDLKKFPLIHRPNNIKIILSVSRLTPYKGFHLLIEAFKNLNKKIPDLKLVIVGSAPKKEYLSYLEKIKNRNVRILTDVSDQELVSLYQKCFLYVTCDQYLFFGLPIVEAALFGKPAVALNFAAASEIIQSGQTGYVAENLNDLEKYMEKLAQNKKLADRLGEKARVRANRLFSWTETAEQYEALLKNTLQKEKVKNKNKMFCFICFLGLSLRVLATWQKPFWFDEAWSWSIARQSLPNIIIAAAADNCPPLYYFLLHFWLKISEEIFFLRLFSLFWGLVLLYIVYLLLRLLSDHKTSLLVTLLFAISPLHIYYSAEIRPYAPWSVFCFAFLYFFLKILKNPQKKYYLFFALFLLLAIYTHYLTIFPALAVNLFLISNYKKYSRQLLKVVICQGVVALAFFPWFNMTLKMSRPIPWGLTPPLGILATFASATLGGLGSITLKTFFSPPVPICIKTLYFFTFLSSIFLFALGIFSEIEKEKKVLLLLLFFIPMVAFFLLSLFHPIYSPRFIIISSLVFYWFIALGLEKISSFWPKVGLIVLLIFVSLSQDFYPLFRPRTLKEAAFFIEKKSTDNFKVVHTDIFTFYPFLYYFRKNINSQFLVAPSGLSLKTTEIVGGSLVPFEEITKDLSSFWSVHYTWDGKTWKFKEGQPKLKKDYQYELVKTINDLEIFYYQPL